MNKTNYQPFLRMFILLIALFVLFIVHYFMFIYLYPFMIAMILAYILQPIVSYLERKWRIHRTFASYLAILFTSSLILLCTILFLQQLAKEMSHLINILPATFHTINNLFIEFGQTTVIPLYQTLQTKLPFLPPTDVWDMKQTIPFIMEKIYDSSSSVIQNIFSSLSTIVSSISQTSIMIIFIVISIFIMTKDYNLLTSYSQNIIPMKIRKNLTEIVFQLKKSTFGLVKAHFFLAVLSSCLGLVGLLIIGVENFLLLTIIIFIVDFVPYIGIGAIFIPWILYQFMSGEYGFTIQLTIVYMVITIVRQLIEPKLIATHLGIHPIIALILLFISIKHFGILGIFITPLILIGLSAVYHANILSTIQHFIFEHK